MPESEIFTIRMTPQRGAQIEALSEMTGLQGPAAVIDFALATTLAHYVAKESEMADYRKLELGQVIRLLNSGKRLAIPDSEGDGDFIFTGPIKGTRLTYQRRTHQKMYPAEQMTLKAFSDLFGSPSFFGAVDESDRYYYAYIEEADETNERRWDRMAKELDQVVANAETVEDATEELFELGWSKGDIDAALDDPNFPDLPRR